MKLQLANSIDLARAQAGDTPIDEVRRFTCSGVVDSGAAHLVLPQAAMDQLGLPESWQAKTRYTDGSTGERSAIKNVSRELCGRESVFSAVIEPGRQDAFVGTIMMEELDLVIDCVTAELLPRDPEKWVAELDECNGMRLVEVAHPCTHVADIGLT